MRLSSKQRKIIVALRTQPDGLLTLGEAVDLIGGNLYANAEKHVGAVLSNMVRKGLIDRVRPGLFRAKLL